MAHAGTASGDHGNFSSKILHVGSQLLPEILFNVCRTKFLLKRCAPNNFYSTATSSINDGR
jgi:hypothetical protein